MLERIWKKILRREKLSLWVLPAFFLWLASLLYRVGRGVHLIAAGKPVTASVPVISIGNITVGGSGKTTMVAMVARLLQEEGVRVGIVSSGYGREEEAPIVAPGYKIQNMDSRRTGDEIHYLAKLLPQVMFSVDRSKSEAAVRLGAAGEVDVIVVDDGMQHRRLHRDLEIVTFDASIPNRLLKLLPYGILREPISALERADIILITRANMVDDEGVAPGRLKRQFPNSVIYRARFLSHELIGKERNRPVKYLEDKSVFLFAGIGNFKAMARQVRTLCADLDYTMELADHQQYDHELLKRIKNAADETDPDVILTTGKDWVKLGDFDFGREIYYLSQSIDLDPGEEKLVRYLMKKLNLKRSDS